MDPRERVLLREDRVPPGDSHVRHAPPVPRRVRRACRRAARPRRGRRSPQGRPHRLRRPRHRGRRRRRCSADKNVKLVAMGDAFEDRLQRQPRRRCKKNETSPPRSTCRRTRSFVGFDAYKQVIARVRRRAARARRRTSGRCTCRPRSRPASTSSPRSRCAVDAPGVRSVLETCEAAKKKNLSVVSGLCLRYDNGFRETVQAHPRRRDRRDRRAAGQRLPRRPLGQAAAAGLDRHELADAQLVLLHLAVGRLQRRAARPLPRRVRLGDEGRVPGRRRSAWAAGRCAPARSTATSTTTSRSSTSTPDGAQALQQLPAAAGLQERHERPRARARKGRALLSETRRRAADQDRRRSGSTTGPNNDMYQTEHDELFAASAAASRSTTASTWPRARCWRSWAAWPPTPARRSPGSMALNSKEDLTPAEVRLEREAAGAAGRRCRA